MCRTSKILWPWRTLWSITLNWMLPFLIGWMCCKLIDLSKGREQGYNSLNGCGKNREERRDWRQNQMKSRNEGTTSWDVGEWWKEEGGRKKRYDKVNLVNWSFGTLANTKLYCLNLFPSSFFTLDRHWRVSPRYGGLWPKICWVQQHDWILSMHVPPWLQWQWKRGLVWRYFMMSSPTKLCKKWDLPRMLLFGAWVRCRKVYVRNCMCAVELWFQCKTLHFKYLSGLTTFSKGVSYIQDKWIPLNGNKVVTLLQSKPVGHIWGTCGPHMGTRFATYGAFSTYGKENASGSETYGEPIGHFFFKHMGPFSNILGLLKHMGPLSMQQKYMPGDLFNFLFFFCSFVISFVFCLFYLFVCLR